MDIIKVTAGNRLRRQEHSVFWNSDRTGLPKSLMHRKGTPWTFGTASIIFK